MRGGLDRGFTVLKILNFAPISPLSFESLPSNRANPRSGKKLRTHHSESGEWAPWGVAVVSFLHLICLHFLAKSLHLTPHKRACSWIYEAKWEISDVYMGRGIHQLFRSEWVNL